jgi:hypothetical protein
MSQPDLRRQTLRGPDRRLTQKTPGSKGSPRRALDQDKCPVRGQGLKQGELLTPERRKKVDVWAAHEPL